MALLTTLSRPVGLMATAVLLASAPMAAQAEDVTPTLSISGEGEVSIAPDMATVMLSVLRQAPTAKEALAANNAAMGEVMAAMKAFGIEDRDLQTSQFSVNPVYVYPDDSNRLKMPKIVAYEVRNGLGVRVRDLSKLGEVLDSAVTLGVNDGGGIQFGNDDPKEAIKAARVAAMKDAIDRAETLVGAANIKLGRIISINENFNRPYPIPMMKTARSMEMVAADAVPVAAGENAYSVTVNVTFELEE